MAEADLEVLKFFLRNKKEQSSLLPGEILSCQLGMGVLALRKVLGTDRVVPCKAAKCVQAV